jgi:hypothetical protein
LTPGDLRGLADVVRTAKACLSRARSSMAKLARNEADLAKTLNFVDAISTELASANSEPQSELSSISNGGPPLDDAKGASHPPYGGEATDGLFERNSHEELGEAFLRNGDRLNVRDWPSASLSATKDMSEVDAKADLKANAEFGRG